VGIDQLDLVSDRAALVEVAGSRPISSFPPPHVAILMCSYNGERYLAEQLDSFEAQTYKSWTLWVSDDGSRDETLEILERYQLRWGEDRLHIVHGPSKGFAPNFLSLVCRTEIQAHFYAYSDQDDVWRPNKLERAMNAVGAFLPRTPLLYCSRTQLVDESLKPIGTSPRFDRRPSFRNALTQNIAGGNTMVFNDSARNVLLAAGPRLRIVAHDWWTYLAVSAAGGNIVYDDYLALLYRQHSSNLIGSNQGWAARFTRIRMLMQGQLRRWTDANLDALDRVVTYLPIENARVLGEFSNTRNRGVLDRLRGFKRSGLYRQTRLGNLGLWTAVIFKKL
jgi:glycosyltransferase involved in cell wall biosynthesis